MSLTFKRTEGAYADTKELEYIVALHQTCIPETRENGTVSSLDIERFLQSRYGHIDSYQELVNMINKTNTILPDNDEMDRTNTKKAMNRTIGFHASILSNSIVDAVRELGGNVYEPETDIETLDGTNNNKKLNKAKVVWDATANAFRLVKSLPKAAIDKTNQVVGNTNVLATTRNIIDKVQLKTNEIVTRSVIDKVNLKNNPNNDSSTLNPLLEEVEEKTDDTVGTIANESDDGMKVVENAVTTVSENTVEPATKEVVKKETLTNVDYIVTELKEIEQQTMESMNLNDDVITEQQHETLDMAKINEVKLEDRKEIQHEVEAIMIQDTTASTEKLAAKIDEFVLDSTTLSQQTNPPGTFSSNNTNSNDNTNDYNAAADRIVVHDEEFLDIVQILAILLIPTFMDYRNERTRSVMDSSPTTATSVGGESEKMNIKQHPPKLIETVLSILLHDVFHNKNHATQSKDFLDELEWNYHHHQARYDIHSKDNYKDDDNDDDNHGASNKSIAFPIINAALVRQILINVGEVERAENEALVREMVQACTVVANDAQQQQQQRQRLDIDAFIQALTFDTMQWNNVNNCYWPNYENVTNQRTTYLDDVLNGNQYGTTAVGDDSNGSGGGCNDDENTESKASFPPPATRVAAPMTETGENTATGQNVSTASFADNTTTNADGITKTTSSSKEKTRSATAAATTNTVRTSIVTKAAKWLLFDPYSIDYVLDSHTSIVSVVLIWSFFLCICFTYASLFQSSISTECQSDATVTETLEDIPYAFGCQLLSFMYTWLVYAVCLSFFGFVIVLPVSWGNNPYHLSYTRNIVSLMLVLVYTFIPYAITRAFINQTLEENGNNSSPSVNGGAESVATSLYFNNVLNLTLVMGMIVASWIVWNMVLLLFRNKNMQPTQQRLHNNNNDNRTNNTIAVTTTTAGNDEPKKKNTMIRGWFQYIITPSNTIGESRSKISCIRKVNKMLHNAISLHHLDQYNHQNESRTIDNTDNDNNNINTNNTVTKDQTKKNTGCTNSPTLNYILLGKDVVSTGGIIWTWKLLFSNELFETEGIWIPTRLIIIQCAQLIFLIVMGFVYLSLVPYFADIAQKANEEIQTNQYADFIPDWVFTIVPTERDVKVALYPASVIAIIVMILLFVIYIPSAVSTIVQFRCGTIPSLGSRYFVPYRNAVASIYMNTGNAVFGLLGSSLLYFLLVGLIIFLYFWDFSRPLMIKITAWGLGLTITITIKVILVNTCQTRQYKSFYRSRPGSANYTSLALECWYIGLGPSVLIGRITQFLFASMFWIGRIDVEYLSQDVRLFGYHFDNVPMYFVKDILVHEAHRHPYIERLGQLYILKLLHNHSYYYHTSTSTTDTNQSTNRNDQNQNQPPFITCAGSVWRQVFVLVLMPWLRKYRVLNEERAMQSQSMLVQQQIEKEYDEQGFVERIGSDFDNITNTKKATTAVTKIVGQVVTGNY